jgi:hypothetical protein
MKKCICGNIIPPNRRQYCSKTCIKRAWYIKNTRGNCYYNNDKQFWDSETGVGLRWEKWVAKKLGAKHLLFNLMGCDLDWNGVKVDVKSSNIYKRKNHHGKKTKGNNYGWWVFNRNKEKDCDMFACVCVRGDSVEKWYLIPSTAFPPRGTTIGRTSKYDRYLVKE